MYNILEITEHLNILVWQIALNVCILLYKTKYNNIFVILWTFISEKCPV